MNTEKYYKAIFFAVLAAVFAILHSPGPALFSALVCLLTAIDGAVDALKR